MIHDALGNRIKANYEDRYRFMLPRRTYTIVRVDGRAFHTLTRRCDKPFDADFGYAMDAVARALCEDAQGAQCAYVQSDECSMLLTDFALPTTDAWFDGNVQKICSISAANATRAFNATMMEREHEHIAHGTFDARVFTIPDRTEVMNYFIWRQQDAERNSLAGLCQKHYSHKELHGVGRSRQHELLHKAGVNWADISPYWKRGRMIVRKTCVDPYWAVDNDTPVFRVGEHYMETLVPRIDADETPASVATAPVPCV